MRKHSILRSRIRIYAILFILFTFYFTSSNVCINQYVDFEDENIPQSGSASVPEKRIRWEDSAKWELIFSDEFDGDGPIDGTKWESLEYNRRGNDNGPDGWWLKDQVYLNGKGQLVISFNKVKNLNDDNDSYDYATGVVRTKNKFENTYGKYEIRCKLPTQKGWWVAFWMVTDQVTRVDGTGTDGAEIDIFEGFGWNNIIYHSVHWDGYGSAHKALSSYTRLKNRDEYHTYSLIWTPTDYQFYVDGVLTWQTEGGGASSVPEYIKISGETTSSGWIITDKWANDPQEAKFPDEFLIDYVRVYKYKD